MSTPGGQRRGRTVTGTNAGSYAPHTLSAPGTSAQLSPGAAEDDFDQDAISDADYDADLAYLRSVLDRDLGNLSDASVIDDPICANTTAPNDGVRPLWEISGADMPPLTFTHPDPLDPSKITPLAQELIAKPRGGLWVTIGDATSTEPNRWEQFLDSSGLREGDDRPHVRTAVRLRSDARVARIDSMADLADLCELFPNDPGYDDDFRELLGRGADRPVDWEKVAATYDAVWVTQDALNDGVYMALYGWDFESAVITSADALDFG